MKRVMIVGQPGSGKSTLARKLGDATGLPVFHMDHIHWTSGWVPRDDDARWPMVRDIHAKEAWIFEGGFSKSWPERAERADILIWIDVGHWRRLWRVIFRFVRYYNQERPDMAEGCREGNWSEMADFLKFIWRTRHTSRDKIKALLDGQPEDKTIVTLHTIDEANAFVEAARA